MTHLQFFFLAFAGIFAAATVASLVLDLFRPDDELLTDARGLAGIVLFMTLCFWVFA